MPRPKKATLTERRARTHARVSEKPGFRPQREAEGDENQALVDDLRWLEERGFVMFVPTIGWVDSMPAVTRFQKHTGMNHLFSYSSPKSDR